MLPARVSRRLSARPRRATICGGFEARMHSSPPDLRRPTHDYRFTRRQFTRAGAAASLAAVLPQGVFAAPTANHKATIRADDTIGLVRPEFHSHFAEHLGSC